MAFLHAGSIPYLLYNYIGIYGGGAVPKTRLYASDRVSQTSFRFAQRSAFRRDLCGASIFRH